MYTPEEFNKNFAEFNQSKLQVYIKTISYSLGNFPDCDNEYITVDNNIEVRYHNIIFGMKGNYEDDYFVTY